MKEKNFQIRDIIKLRRMAKYGDLLGGLIHNLNTPLMGISGRLELIKFKNPELKGLDQMSEQLDKINEMLNCFATILEHDKNYDYEQISLKEAINNVNHLLQADMKYKHKANVKIDAEEDLYITALPGYLYNILYDALRNCLEAIDEEGEIEISLYQEKNFGVIEIYNNGAHIPEEIIEQIGNELVTTKQEHLGMGLFSLKYYIERLSGSILLSNLESGVLYRLEFPLDKTI